MDDYIKREALRKAIQVDGYEHFSGCLSSSEIRLLEMIDESICQMPAADVAPVVHGKWFELMEVMEDHHSGEYYEEIYYNCMNCDYATCEKMPYCANCGAKMDLEDIQHG